jgi:quercetin dioxygenase-like cupin family protein
MDGVGESKALEGRKGRQRGRCAMKVRTYEEVSPKDLSGERNASRVEMKEMITGADGAPSFSLRVFRLGPEGYTPFHAHPWEHEVFVFEGTGNVVGEGTNYPLRKGCSVFVPQGEMHQFRAGGKGMAFVCCVPHKG